MEDPSISSVWRPWSISLTGTPEGTSEGVIVSFELFAIDPADAALRPKMGRRVGRAFSTRFLKKAAVSDLVKFVKDNLAEFIGRLACQPSVLFHVFDEHHKEVRLDDCVEHYVRAVARKGEDERREEAIFYIFAPYLPPGEGLWWEIEHLSKKRTIFDFEPKLDFNVAYCPIAKLMLPEEFMPREQHVVGRADVEASGSHLRRRAGLASH